MKSVDWFPIQLSFQVAFIATGVALLMGIFLAWVLARLKFFGKEWIDAVITLPLVLPPTVLGYYLLVVLGRGSSVGKLFERMFGFQLTFTPFAAIIAATIHALPLMVKSVRAAFEGVDPIFENVARTLGATEVRLFLTITLPLSS